MSNPQLPFGLQADQLKAGAVRNMTSDKLATFSVGGMKKTPFQKHKEALEAKRREQEAHRWAERRPRCHEGSCAAAQHSAQQESQQAQARGLIALQVDLQVAKPRSFAPSKFGLSQTLLLFNA